MFNIPRPQHYRLDDPPLAQVLVQVRFPLVAHFQDLSGIAKLQDELFDLFPYLEPQQAQVAFQIVVGSAVPIATSPTTVWKFTNDDGWTLTVEPGAIALFTRGEGYRGYEDFAAKFSRVLEALTATNRIARCDRLGIRFINIAEPIPGQERAWMRWFKPELLGLASTGIFGEHTLFLQRDMLGQCEEAGWQEVVPWRSPYARRIVYPRPRPARRCSA